MLFQAFLPGYAFPSPVPPYLSSWCLCCYIKPVHLLLSACVAGDGRMSDNISVPFRCRVPTRKIAILLAMLQRIHPVSVKLL